MRIAGVDLHRRHPADTETQQFDTSRAGIYRQFTKSLRNFNNRAVTFDSLLPLSQWRVMWAGVFHVSGSWPEPIARLGDGDVQEIDRIDYRLLCDWRR
jgi:hypothetical protein